MVRGLHGLTAEGSPRVSTSSRDAGSVRLGGLTAYWLGLSVLWGALTTVVLPRLV